MRYPTDQKLLWECNEKAYSIMCAVCQRLGIHRPRTKFLDVEKANLAYVKQRKHSKSQQRKIIRRLIRLLGKILQEIRKTCRDHDDMEDVLTVKEKNVMEAHDASYWCRVRWRVPDPIGYKGLYL